jgi:hypothetical protein
MSWLFSRALVEAYSEATCLDGVPSAPLKSQLTQQAFSSLDKTTEASSHFQSGMTLEHSTGILGEDLLMWFRGGFHAPTSARQGRRLELTEQLADSGWRWPGSFAKFNRASSGWKTRQNSFIEGLAEFSETWPRWGLMLNGECLDLTTWAPITEGSGSGFWPTPCHGSSHWGGTFQEVGGSKNKLRNTPIGKLYVNPDFWESLMGWPIGWTDCEPLATGKIRAWLRQHGDS